MAKKRVRARRNKHTDDLLGPPPREATIIRTDAERREEEELAGRGSVETPDQDRVDEIGEALGVPRAPDEEIRTSAEILDERDRRRWDMEQP